MEEGILVGGYFFSWEQLYHRLDQHGRLPGKGCKKVYNYT